jgi:hypothetical protein
MFERVDRHRWPCLVELVAGVVAAVLFAACGSGSEPGRSVSSAATRSTTTVRSRVNDRAVVNALVLRPTDLPGAWLSGPMQPNNTTGDAQTTACLGIPNSDSKQTAYAGSHTFTQGAVHVFSTATAFNSRSVVASDLTVRTNPKLTTCIARNVQATDRGTNVHVTKVALPHTAGALNGFDLIGTATIQTSSGPRPIRFEEVALAKGRIELSANIVSLGSNVPERLMDRLIAAIAPRLSSTST